MSSAESVLRVERGSASREELAAVTVVLLSALAARAADGEDSGRPQVPQWSPERPAGTYRSPYHWR
ncbi:acyl-CoA carboxylase epsilon subunit [Streptomyces sp. NPDC049813]|uniref:acyl-CoA carboxylase epsilon subunit n=1 Tax=Streptomyces sp. NPDC049813 TaxID=3365597 RepID=UPI003798967E